MSFDISEIGGFGFGKLGDVEIAEGVVADINSYARISKIDELNDDKIAIDSDTAFIGKYEDQRGQ